MLDPSAVEALLSRARREVDEGLLPSVQIALAYQGEVVVEEVFGDASLDTRYAIFSATKPFVAAAVWTLISEGKLDPEERVAHYFPEFGENGKSEITVEQVMLHTSGFPRVPMGPPAWSDRDQRIKGMADWKLNWEPGTRYEYHATSAHWVLGELIHRVTETDYRDVVEGRITRPLGLPRVLGIPIAEQADIADVVLVGEEATPDEIEAVFGVRELPVTEVTHDTILGLNAPDAREVGVPGGGGVARARDLALFHQSLLHNPAGIWDPDLLRDVTGRVRNNLPDPSGVPANRSLGLLLAGDDGLSHMRGLGRTASPQAFGHNGAGGQLAWADPATGLSIGYVTDGYDVHAIRQPRRGTAISSLAAVCVKAA